MSEESYWRRKGSSVVHIFRPMLDRPSVLISLCERHEFDHGGRLYVPWTLPREPHGPELCKMCAKESE